MVAITEEALRHVRLSSGKEFAEWVRAEVVRP
jgi:hypothetical protein